MTLSSSEPIETAGAMRFAYCALRHLRPTTPASLRRARRRAARLHLRRLHVAVRQRRRHREHVAAVVVALVVGVAARLHQQRDGAIRPLAALVMDEELQLLV